MAAPALAGGYVLTGSAAAAGAGRLQQAPLQDWLAQDPILAAGEFGVAIQEDGASLVKIGDGRVWSETPPLADPFAFTDVKALRRARWLRTGDLARCAGRFAPGDGGAAHWHITSDGPGDRFCTLALENGLFARLAHASQYDMRQAGIFTDTPGPETAQALLSLTEHAIAGGGGIIEIPRPITCNNITFPQIPQRASITFRMQPGVWMRPGNPKPGVFLWDFDPGEWNTYPNFINIRIAGDKKSRTACNGIRIGPTNGMTIDNCVAQFIDGCAWQIEGANNSRIDITTFKCGTKDGVYAQTYTGNTRKNFPSNDLVLQGSSEQDYYGINLEGSVIIREGSAIKLHGGPEVRRALRIHRCASFALKVYASQRWTREGFILITDEASSSGERFVVTRETQGNNTRGTLDIQTMYNIRWMGQENAAWCVVDLQSPSSFLVLRGRIDRQAKPAGPEASYHHFRIMGPGNNGVSLDLEGLQFSRNVAPNTRLRDDRDPEPRHRNHVLRLSTPPDETPRLGEGDLGKGPLDLRGLSFVDLAPNSKRRITRITMTPGQHCTICAPEGRVEIKDSPGLALAGTKSFAMKPGATLSLYCAAPDRIVEISRSAR